MDAHLLLVEDDNDLRDMIARTLRREGYTVTEATNGSHAIELLTQPASDHSPYEVVLSDIVMGEVDGIEVLNVARSQPYRPEVVLLTGHGSLETAIEAVRNNAFDYLLKPSQKTKLLECIAAAVEYHRRSQHQHKAIEIVRSLADFAAQSDELGTSEAATSHPEASPDSAPSRTAEQMERYKEVGQLRIDTHRQEVWFANQQIHVTPTEYLILTFLAERPGRVATFGEMVRRTHSYDLEDSEAHDLLRSHIRNLRRKFDRRYLVSVYATGYMLLDPDLEGG